MLQPWGSDSTDVGSVTTRIEYERLVIAESDGWIWQVHENQCYLGRLLFRLDRAEQGSLASCTTLEWSALFGTIRRYEFLMDQLFKPDRYNYGQLGNVYHQLHVHAVPRYASPRTWRRTRFEDVAWGRNWAPALDSPISLEETYEFAAWMRIRVVALASSGVPLDAPEK